MTTDDHGLRATVVRAFEQRFGQPPAFVARAPGRVNLIGEHTDYNDGFVLPIGFDLAGLGTPGEGWIEYVRGMAWALRAKAAGLGGWDGVTAGDVPIGAGLSSSAAMELATARAFAAVSALDWEPAEMALLAQKAENGWVGVQCGIMDQMISAAGREGHALLIDCRSLETRAVPLPPGTSVVILDTATRRGLVDSAYNDRRRDTTAAAAFLGVPALRDVSEADFDRRAPEMDLVMRRRARHVVTEDERTLRAADALQRGDASEVGRLMNESHASLRDDFEVSRAELDTIVSLAQEEPGCFGARMTGAGFGGCAVALVEASAADRFSSAVAAKYRAATGLDAKVYVCSAAPGASIEPLTAA
jgi:galactokinase